MKNANQRIQELNQNQKDQLAQIKKRESELMNKSWSGRKLSRDEVKEQKSLDLERIALIYNTNLVEAQNLRNTFSRSFESNDEANRHYINKINKSER
jgi:hypothetical protein